MPSAFDDPTNNPYAATAAIETAEVVETTRSYGGLGRLAYFGYTFLAGLIYQIVLVFLGVGAGENATLVVIPVVLIYFVVVMWILAKRIINMGYNPWWCLAMFVPLLNILVGIRAIACPEGYAHHKTLDTAGKIIVGIILACFALVILAVVLASFSG